MDVKEIRRKLFEISTALNAANSSLPNTVDQLKLKDAEIYIDQARRVLFDIE